MAAYTIYTGWYGIFIVLLVSITGMLSTFSANIYLPALNIIQNDLQLTVEQVNLSVTVYMILQGLGPTFWGSMADLFGRRPVYQLTIIVYIGACIGLALTPSYGLLIFFRMLQAFGVSSVIAIGAGAIGDIVEPDNRGKYYGIYTACQFLGPPLGSLVGGAMSQTLSWRWLFWLLVIYGGTVLFALFFCLPETLRSLVQDGSGYANPTPWQWLQHRRRVRSHAQKQEKQDVQDIEEQEKMEERTPDTPDTLADVPYDDDDASMTRASSPSLALTILQSMAKPFLYLVEMDVLLSLIYIGLHYAVMYFYLTSTTNLFQAHFGLNQVQLGLCFLGTGLGGVAGCLVEGRLLDRDFAVTKKAYLAENTHDDSQFDNGKLPRNFPLFKARMRTGWIHSTCMAIVTLIYGWLFQLHAPLAIPIIIQIIVGFCTTCLMTMNQTVLVDLFPGKSASATAANNICRCLLGAVATVTIDPGFKGIGVGPMFVVLGVILLASNICVVLLLIYGQQWRLKRENKTMKAEAN
ncbi:major facilitator superfamily domain-containing protein [Gongronella butleri]|nr:major facilitator superfamily domain-containing protein [Gongronella butleri]